MFYPAVVEFADNGRCGYLLFLCRKKTILFSHIFAFLGAASSSVCVVAGSPELLMLGRVLVGVNSGRPFIDQYTCLWRHTFHSPYVTLTARIREFDSHIYCSPKATNSVKFKTAAFYSQGRQTTRLQMGRGEVKINSKNDFIGNK